MKYSRSGQYELIKLSVYSNSSKPVELDLRLSFVDITVYESIYDMFMSGSISFVDTSNIAQRYALGNGDIVKLAWRTTGLDVITYEGVSYDVQGPARIGDHASAYTLHFTSKEMIHSLRTKLFNGYRDTCSNIVKSIFSKMSSSKKIEISETRNIEHLVMAGHSPVEAIRMCKNRSVSSQNSFGYLFYEDNKQFNYVPLQDMYKATPISEYVFKGSPVYDDVKNVHEESFNTIQDIEKIDMSSYMKDLKDGLYGTSSAYFSIGDKKLFVKQSSAEILFKQDKSLSKSPSLLSLDNPSKTDKLLISFSNDREFNFDVIHNSDIVLNKANTIGYNIGVFGNSNLRCGTVSVLNIPSYSSDGFSNRDFDMISGRFLAAEIKHYITPKSYNQRIQFIKDGYEGRIE